MPGFMKREKRVSLNLASSQKCSERFIFNFNTSINCFLRYPVFNNEICAGLQTSNGDIRGFKGDINFGAALICYEKNDFLQNKPILAGIASRKHWSPNHDSPGMYTNIYKEKKSIKKKLGDIIRENLFLLAFALFDSSEKN